MVRALGFMLLAGLAQAQSLNIVPPSPMPGGSLILDAGGLTPNGYAIEIRVNRTLVSSTPIELAPGPQFALPLVLVQAAAQEFEIPWHTVDAGGELSSTGGEWTLSGTIGQWDVDTEAPAEGGSWSLSGGFWASDAPESDALFRNGFEG